ncbi:uncharacterized protein N7487_003028 [Penicillium crustosum]|uniref:uncharacterized protein n=1 Tax=Penicillium crustosum TaxID=36656 RepID=UPI00238486E5|nr:uncharacterized protein N7487_003028 [Penicillium crustosum]KAJ5419478.1 hypothetical protein N7487_003028 [Penicillium crustosum]
MLCDSQNALQPEEPQGNNDDELNRYLAKGSLPPLPSLDPISDSEEAEDEDTVTEIPSQLQPQVQSENTRPKRPRSRSTQSQEEVIPEPADLENTQRPSRVRKKTRMPEGFEIGTP